MVVDTQLARPFAQLAAECLEIAQIIVAHSPGIDEHFLIRRFQVAELRQSFVGKIKLLRSEYLQQDDFVTPMPQML